MSIHPKEMQTARRETRKGNVNAKKDPDNRKYVESGAKSASARVQVPGRGMEGAGRR